MSTLVPHKKCSDVFRGQQRVKQLPDCKMYHKIKITSTPVFIKTSPFSYLLLEC